jgi:hypothetical protein
MKSIKFAGFILCVSLLNGCAIKAVHFDENSATYEHYRTDFAFAMKQAAALCKGGSKKGIKHESTHCARDLMCISTFNCIPE